MSRVFRFAFVGLAVAGLGSVANAQVCAGTPSFSVGSARLGASMLIGDNAKAYGVQGALGAHKGWFLSGDYSHAKDDNSDGSSNAGGATIGYEWSVNTTKSVEFCPMVGVQAQNGSLIGLHPTAPNDPQNTLDWHFGGALGWVATQSGDMMVIPSIGAAIVARSYKSTIVMQGQPNPNTTETFGQVTGAIGFVLKTQWTISPMVQVPLSETNGKTAYGVAVSYNFNLPKHGHI